jgi:hypothetical protein
MSVPQILSTLSDTELIVLSREIGNPDISNLDILGQLFSKANYNFNREDMLKEIVDSFPQDLCLELSKRFQECLKS